MGASVGGLKWAINTNRQTSPSSSLTSSSSLNALVAIPPFSLNLHPDTRLILVYISDLSQTFAMPSINRSLFVAVQAAALCAFLIASPAPVAAMASPMPMPLPLASSDMNTLYHKPAVKDITHKSTRVKHTAPIASVARRNLAVIIAKRASIAASKSRRAASGSDTDDADYTKMQGLYNQASTHAQNLSMHISLLRDS